MSRLLKHKIERQRDWILEKIIPGNIEHSRKLTVAELMSEEDYNMIRMFNEELAEAVKDLTSEFIEQELNNEATQSS